jgi:hypothetical protein
MQVEDRVWTEVLLQKNKQEEDEIITLDPETIWSGLAKVGGCFAFLNIAVLCMRMLHQVLMKRELEKYLLEQAGIQKSK